MDLIQREMRKIRKTIRDNAKSAGLSADQYRKQNGYTVDWIRKQAQEASGKEVLETTHNKKTKPATSHHKSYDGVSNKGLFESLCFGKPTYRIAHSDTHDWDWLVRLAPTGHYLPYKKIHRSENGEARSLNEKPVA